MIRFLDDHEARLWLGARDMLSDDLSALFDDAPFIRLPSVESSGFRTIPLTLTRGIVCNEVLLWITEYGFFSSSQDEYLFAALRRYSGGPDKISEAAAMVFEGEDTRALVSYLSLAFSFRWGGLYVNYPQHYLHFSHDGWAELSSNEQQVQYFTRLFKESRLTFQVVGEPSNQGGAR